MSQRKRNKPTKRKQRRHPGFTKEDRELFMKAIARKGGLNVRF